MQYFNSFLFDFYIFARFSSICEKTEKNRAAILRRTAAVFVCELSSRPDW